MPNLPLTAVQQRCAGFQVQHRVGTPDCCTGRNPALISLRPQSLCTVSCSEWFAHLGADLTVTRTTPPCCFLASKAPIYLKMGFYNTTFRVMGMCGVPMPEGTPSSRAGLSPVAVDLTDGSGDAEAGGNAVLFEECIESGSRKTGYGAGFLHVACQGH